MQIGSHFLEGEFLTLLCICPLHLTKDKAVCKKEKKTKTKPSTKLSTFKKLIQNNCLKREK